METLDALSFGCGPSEGSLAASSIGSGLLTEVSVSDAVSAWGASRLSRDILYNRVSLFIRLGGRGSRCLLDRHRFLLLLLGSGFLLLFVGCCLSSRCLRGCGVGRTFSLFGNGRLYGFHSLLVAE